MCLDERIGLASQKHLRDLDVSLEAGPGERGHPGSIPRVHFAPRLYESLGRNGETSTTSITYMTSMRAWVTTDNVGGTTNLHVADG